MRCFALRAPVACLIVVSLVAPLAAVDGKKAMYVGGTISGLKEQTEGKLDTSSDTALTFTADKNRGTVTVPWVAISELEYGQNAGRRVAMAILVSPLALFSKKRKHYLTVNYKDAEGKDQAVVLELGKDIVRTTLTVVETRSGKEITYQDEDARKAAKGK